MILTHQWDDSSYELMCLTTYGTIMSVNLAVYPFAGDSFPKQWCPSRGGIRFRWLGPDPLLPRPQDWRGWKLESNFRSGISRLRSDHSCKDVFLFSFDVAVKGVFQFSKRLVVTKLCEQMKLEVGVKLLLVLTGRLENGYSMDCQGLNSSALMSGWSIRKSAHSFSLPPCSLGMLVLWPLFC